MEVSERKVWQNIRSHEIKYYLKDITFQQSHNNCLLVKLLHYNCKAEDIILLHIFSICWNIDTIDPWKWF